jgi:hypothetical protein
MNRQRGLWAGISVLLILTGCSKDKTLNVEGAYTPVITNLASDHEPPVRGIVNAVTAVVSNPRGYTVQYQWSTSAGTLTDATSQTAHWTPPDSIGVYPLTVSIQAHDGVNNVDFSRTRTFLIPVDNEFERWTRSVALQFDVVPPAGGKIYFSQVRNTSTLESDVWAVSAPLGSILGSPVQITRYFWQATAPTAQSDGSQIAFLGRVRGSDGGASIYQVPPTGGDTITSSLLVLRSPNNNSTLGTPRFAPSGSMLLYESDTTANSANFGRPKPWMRDAANLGLQPIPIAPTTADPLNNNSAEFLNAYWNGAWSGLGDSIVVESYDNFQFPNIRTSRGLYKLSASGSPPTNPEPFPQWLSDLTATEPDWSHDGQHIVFAKRVPGRTDRDIWIINAHASDPAAAVRVTSGIADEFHPRFSSDGSKIFFVSNRIDGYGANGFYDTERRGTNIWSVSRFDLP